MNDYSVNTIFVKVVRKLFCYIFKKCLMYMQGLDYLYVKKPACRDGSLAKYYQPRLFICKKTGDWEMVTGISLHFLWCIDTDNV